MSVYAEAEGMPCVRGLMGGSREGWGGQRSQQMGAADWAFMTKLLKHIGHIDIHLKYGEFVYKESGGKCLDLWIFFSVR